MRKRFWFVVWKFESGAATGGIAECSSKLSTCDRSYFLSFFSLVISSHTIISFSICLIVCQLFLLILR